LDGEAPLSNLDWDSLTKKYGDLEYLETNFTLNDYADQNKAIIREVSKIKTKLNTGKVVHLKSGQSMYLAEVTANGKSTVFWAFLNKIEPKKTAFEKFLAFYGL
jgi:hypothetical protein